MPAPTRAAVVQSTPAWGSSGSATRTATLAGCAIGDLLVVIGVTEDHSNSAIGISTSAGSTSVWTTRANFIGTDNVSCGISGWTATVTGAGSVTVSCTGATIVLWGFKVARYAVGTWTVVGDLATKFPTSTNSDEMDTSVGTNFTLDALVNTQANSAIEIMVGDWTANVTDPTVGEREETDAGTFTVETYFPGNGSNFGVHGGYYADAGAAGAKQVGFNTIRKPALVAIEVTGVAGSTVQGVHTRRMPIGA